MPALTPMACSPALLLLLLLLLASSHPTAVRGAAVSVDEGHRVAHTQQHVLYSGSTPDAAHYDVDPSTRTSSFSLVHAVHLGGYQYPGLSVQHPFPGGVRDGADSLSPNALAATFDRPPEYSTAALNVKTVRQKIWRPSHPARSEVYEAARRLHWHSSSRTDEEGRQLQALGEQLSWQEVEEDVPDVTDVETLSTLAKLSANAYAKPKDSGWYDLSNATEHPGHSYNLSSSFGWEEDGIRGHIFSNSPNNETIIVAVKGTSAFSGGIGGPTGRNDKLNDNLLFSCCCARVDWTWSPVCDCYNGTPNTCNLTCLEDALIEKSVYYPTATDLFNNITAMYPTSKIWLTGHSLGGSLASLLAITFGIPCVTFEAPGDLTAAKRLHLPLPPGADWDQNRPELGVTHVYTNSDPIPQGACTGALSACTIAGFALETKCHTGQSIVYDAVGKLGWGVDIRTHRIGVIIDRLLIEDWDKDAEEGVRDVPDAGLSVAAGTATAPSPVSTAESQYRAWWGWPWPGKGKKKKPEDGDGDDDDNGEPETPPPEKKKKSHVPKAEIDRDCIDCFKWEFYDDDGTGPPGNDSSVLSPVTWDRLPRTRRSACGGR